MDIPNIEKLKENKNLISSEDAMKAMTVSFGTTMKNKVMLNTLKKHIDIMLLDGVSKEEILNKTSSVITAAMATGDFTVNDFKEVNTYLLKQVTNVSIESIKHDATDKVFENTIGVMSDIDSDDSLLIKYNVLKASLAKVSKELVNKYTNFVNEIECSFEKKYKKILK